MNASEWFTEQLQEAGSAFSLKIKQKLHEEQSDFQHLEIYDTETFGKLMVIDGCTMVSTRENFFYHEMMSHPALFTHPNPKRVWIIGGGDCGTLRAGSACFDVADTQKIKADVFGHHGTLTVFRLDHRRRICRLFRAVGGHEFSIAS